MKRFTLAALATGGAATVAMLLGPGIAAADATSIVAPLLDSPCSFAQVDKALHAKAPILANMLDNNPAQKAELQAKFDLPPDQRRAALQQAINDNPDAAAQAQNDPRAAAIADQLAQVAAVCQSY
ncbi:hemophore-related protein [Nocardia panacis]|uniref:Hemophore-related protein n=1 Tax=Nocardia panacis TaxID=2340916 RepID=A0A3A4K2G0_9NOCA|nr:hemophore-related protein [Nocardia panacis]RJO78814.1 hemophore-related protein [Nocardia panacis]